MKVTFKTDELQRRLAQLGGVVAKKPTLEVFNYVWLYTQADNNAVHLRGMDIDATLDVTLKAAVADGAVNVLLPYAKLTEIANAIPAPETVITVTGEESAIISAGRMRGQDLETYPLVNLPSFLENPTASKAQIGLPGFKEQIGSIIYVINDSKENKFAPSVAKLESTETELKLIATDGFRLVVSTVPQNAGVFSLTLPKPALEKITRLEGGETGTLTIAEVEAGFYFYTGSEVLTINRTAGEFPPYERIIPQGDPASTITIQQTKELLAVIHMIKPSADKEKPVLVFTAKDGLLVAEAATKKQALAKAGEMRFAGVADLDAVSTAPADFSLDVKLLLPFLENVADTPLVINVKSSTAIVDFHGGNGKVRFLQMPTNPGTRS
jgi:DNA polymerase-3 subunit beta